MLFFTLLPVGERGELDTWSRLGFRRRYYRGVWTTSLVISSVDKAQFMLVVIFVVAVVVVVYFTTQIKRHHRG